MKQYIIGKSIEEGKITHYHSIEEAESSSVHYKIMDADSWRDAKLMYEEWYQEYQELNN